MKDYSREMEMTRGYILSLEEFDNFLNEISEGKVGAKSESGEWFYVTAEDISDEEIMEMIGGALGFKEYNVTTTNVIVDITNNKVVITYDDI